MVSKTVERNRLFNWNLNFDTDIEEGGWFIYYYDPNGVDMYKIQLDMATKTLAKNLRTQILTWMNQTDTWVGSVVEHWQKQIVHKESDVEDWVLI